MKKKRILFLAALISSTLSILTITAYGIQMEGEEEAGLGLSIFAQGGYKNFLMAPDTFNTLYDSSDGVLFGGGIKYYSKEGFLLTAEADFLIKKGERVWVSTGGETVKTGISEDLTIIPILGTIGYCFFSSDDVKVYAGVGGGLYLVNVDCEEDIYDRNENGFGFFGVLGAEFSLTADFYISIEGRYESVSGLIGERGVPAIFEEDDLGGINVLLRVGIIL